MHTYYYIHDENNGRKYFLHFLKNQDDPFDMTYLKHFVVVPLLSALKLEKSAISKVQKTLFAFSKMAKNPFLHEKKV